MGRREDRVQRRVPGVRGAIPQTGLTVFFFGLGQHVVVATALASRYAPGRKEKHGFPGAGLRAHHVYLYKKNSLSVEFPGQQVTSPGLVGRSGGADTPTFLSGALPPGLARNHSSLSKPQLVTPGLRQLKRSMGAF